MGCCKDGIRRAVGATKHYAKGAAKLAKSAAGIDLADKATIARRRAICDACDLGVPCAKDASRKCSCTVCGCWIRHKTRLKAEQCPEGKWAGINPPD